MSQPPPTQTLSALSSPPTKLVDALAMDFLLIELVPSLMQSSGIATSRAKKIEEMVQAGLVPPPLPIKDRDREATPGPRDSTASLQSVGRGTTKGGGGGDDEEESVRIRLEGIGLHVGANFTERLCLNRTLFNEPLDAVKFICKDIWTACWDKQVDNLRTNHRGVYVLTDNQFKPVARISSWDGRADAIRRAKIYTAMPVGIIKGALSRLGYQCSVTSEITSLPACTFQIKMPKT